MKTLTFTECWVKSVSGIKNIKKRATGFWRLCLLSFMGGSKRVINFPWIFYVMWSLIPVRHFGIYPGTYSLGLFADLFSEAMGYCLPIVSCEMTRTKSLVLKDHIGST